MPRPPTPTPRHTLLQLKRIARAIYSNPPVHGARVVAEVVGNEEMFDLWRGEMDAMAGRIKVGWRMRARAWPPCVPTLVHPPTHPSTRARAHAPIHPPTPAHSRPHTSHLRQAVRQELYNELVALNPDKDWGFVLSQIGMFSFTGMTPAQCDNMTNKVGAAGRACVGVAGYPPGATT